MAVVWREENFQDFEELINSEVKIIFKDQKLTPWTMNQRGDCGSLVRNGVWEGMYVKVRSMCLRVFPQLFLLIWKFTEFFLWLDVPWFNIYHIRKNQVLSSGTGLPSTTNLCFSQMKNRNQYDMSGGKTEFSATMKDLKDEWTLIRGRSSFKSSIWCV